MLSPVLLALLFGIIEFGWAFHCSASVRAAVTRETRLLIADPTTSAAKFQTAVQTDLKTMADPNVKITFANVAVGTGTLTRVSWNYTHPILYLFLPNVTMNFSASVLVPQ